MIGFAGSMVLKSSANQVLKVMTFCPCVYVAFGTGVLTGAISERFCLILI